MGERGRVVAIMILAVVALAVGEALVARGLKQPAGAGESWWSQLRGLLTNGYVVAGVGLVVVHFGLYMIALSATDLSFALPLTAGSYPLGALLARYYLGESVSPTRWLGIAIITLGVAIVGLGEGRSQ
jgi:drug/metabolite transporter (DMT)-like permease